MPNKWKQDIQKKKMKQMGPPPEKPDHVPMQVWTKSTINARRALAKTKKEEDIVDTVKKAYIPEGACVQRGGQRWVGEKYLTWSEWLSLRSNLVRRSNHDRLEESGRRGFDVEEVFG